MTDLLERPIRNRYRIVALVAFLVAVISILIPGHQMWLSLPAIIGGLYGAVGSRRYFGALAAEREAPEVEAAPSDSNGFREMQWCACGSKEDSEPVTVDVDGDGDVETIGWLCPTCRGDRHGSGPEPVGGSTPKPPSGPGAVTAWQATTPTRTLGPLCSYCGKPEHAYEGTHTYRTGADGGPATGKPTDVFGLKPKPYTERVEGYEVARARDAMRLLQERIDTIYQGCSADSNAVYVSEGQHRELTRLYEEAHDLRALIEELEKEQRIAEDACDHEWTEVRSHDGRLASRWCDTCERRERGV